MNKVICFDIGGTGCQWILFDKDRIIKKGEFKTTSLNKEAVLKEVASIVKENGGTELKIGISSPTAINMETGYSYGISAIDGYGNFNLFNELTNELGDAYDIKATNDANAALLGSLFFEDNKVDNAVLVSLGTGIGGAIYLNGKILSGKNGFAGEFGYGMVMNEKKNISQCLSTIALTREVKETANLELSGKEIWDKFKKGELVEIVQGWIKRNARFFAFLTYSFNPDVIFIGGGISSNKEFVLLLKDAIKKELDDYGVQDIMPNIKSARSASDAGIYGALSLFKQREED